MNPIFEEARRLTLQRFGKTVQMYAPLYLSNECVDTCVYCGFSRPLKIARKTLSVEEVLEEAALLAKQGFRHLLLVSGEHPQKVSTGYLEGILRALRPRMASLQIEVAPMEEGAYRRLIAAGLDGITLYQETYHRGIYGEVHVAGPKKNYEARIRSAEAAGKAGIRTLNIGVLLGLAPWEGEIAALIAHARHLMKRYWRTELRISLPRLKNCAAQFKPLHPVDDETFADILAKLRIALPEAGLVISTREPAELRERLLPLGITHMSAGSRTEPGGYAHPEASGKQFELADHRPPAEVAAALSRLGYEPVWKDL